MKLAVRVPVSPSPTATSPTDTTIGRINVRAKASWRPLVSTGTRLEANEPKARCAPSPLSRGRPAPMVWLPSGARLYRVVVPVRRSRRRRRTRCWFPGAPGLSPSRRTLCTGRRRSRWECRCHDRRAPRKSPDSPSRWTTPWARCKRLVGQLDAVERRLSRTLGVTIPDPGGAGSSHRRRPFRATPQFRKRSTAIAGWSRAFVLVDRGREGYRAGTAGAVAPLGRRSDGEFRHPRLLTGSPP